ENPWPPGSASGVPAGACRHRRPGCGACRPGRPCSPPAAAHPLVDDRAFGRVEQAEQDLAEALDRIGAGLAVGAGEPLALAVGEVALELLALFGEPQPAFAAVARAALLLDIGL